MAGGGEEIALSRMARRGKQHRPFEDRFALRFPALATRINAWLTQVTLRLPRQWRLRQVFIEYSAWRAYNALGRGDVDVPRIATHPEAVWDLSRVVIGESRPVGGRDGVTRANERLIGEWSRLSIDVVSIREVKPNVFFLHLHQHGIGRASGAPAEMDIFEVLQLRDGLVFRGTFFSSATEALQAANTTSP